MPDTTSAQPQHTVVYIRRPSGEWQVDCSCGALWTHKADETEERMSSIYQSHLAYFNRPPTQVL